MGTLAVEILSASKWHTERRYAMCTVSQDYHTPFHSTAIVEVEPLSLPHWHDRFTLGVESRRTKNLIITLLIQEAREPSKTSQPSLTFFPPDLATLKPRERSHLFFAYEKFFCYLAHSVDLFSNQHLTCQSWAGNAFQITRYTCLQRGPSREILRKDHIVSWLYLKTDHLLALLAKVSIHGYLGPVPLPAQKLFFSLRTLAVFPSSFPLIRTALL